MSLRSTPICERSGTGQLFVKLGVSEGRREPDAKLPTGLPNYDRVGGKHSAVNGCLGPHRKKAAAFEPRTTMNNVGQLGGELLIIYSDRCGDSDGEAMRTIAVRRRESR